MNTIKRQQSLSLLTVLVVSSSVHVVVRLPLWRHLERLDEDDSDDHETEQCGEYDARQRSVRIRCETTETYGNNNNNIDFYIAHVLLKSRSVRYKNNIIFFFKLKNV